VADLQEPLMLRQRLITGSILIGSILGLVWLDDQCTIRDGGGVVFAALFAILIPLAAAEAARLGRDCGIRTPTGLTVIVALTMFLAGVTSLLVSDPTLAAGLAMLGPAAGFAIASIGLAATRRIEGAFMGAATIAGIAIWTGLLPVFWLSAFRDHGAWLVAGLVLVVKSGDIGAYFTGMAVGRHKLIPWLSPKKTIEGGIGALLFGGLAGAGLAALTAGQPENMSLSMTAGVVGGVSLAFVGGLGDLLESLLKRAAGAKDSGSIVPGMGGILDVLDSPLVAGPVAWLILRLGTGG
jgi:phosphatidate cytidylyltransferase